MMNTGAIIQDLIDWIDNHLDSRLDIDTVARRAGYSKWHLQRIFKEHTGQPLGEYIRAQKLQKSIERLAHSNEPILNVAIALGFELPAVLQPQLQAPVRPGARRLAPEYQPLCCADISSAIRMTGEGQS